MAIPYSKSISTFNGNGTAIDFPFTFKVWDVSQLVVALTGPDGIVTNPAFTATLTDSGGTVRCLVDNAPVPVGYTLSVLRNMPFDQEVDLISGTRFDPQVVEDQMDKATAERQQLLEAVGRAIVVPPGNEDPPELLAQQIFEARDQASASAANAELSAQKSEAQAALAAAEADRATAQVERAAAKANKILTLSVSAHESPNDAVAAEYTPETGMLHLFVPRGPKGEMGVAGPHGVQGPQGERGHEGVAGSQGAQGETGPQGMQGEAGPQGVQGEKGDAGPQGPRGEALTVDVIHCGGAARTQVSVIDCGNASTFAPPPILH